MGQEMSQLRAIWRRNFTLPRRGKTPIAWLKFAFWWLWSVVGVVPGALVAAYVVGRFHITNEQLQGAISIACAFVSMVFVQFETVTLIAAPSPFKREVDRLKKDGHLPWWAYLVPTVWEEVTFRYVCPFTFACVGLRWYIAATSTSAHVALTGASGALAIKVFLILANCVVIPAVKGAVISNLTKRFWRWLRGDKVKVKGA